MDLTEEQKKALEEAGEKLRELATENPVKLKVFLEELNARLEKLEIALDEAEKENS